MENQCLRPPTNPLGECDGTTKTGEKSRTLQKSTESIVKTSLHILVTIIRNDNKK